MIRPVLLLLSVTCAASAAFAQPVAPSSPALPVAETQPSVPKPAPKPATVHVTLQTSQGAIVVQLEKERAPITTANFLRYVDQKRFDGISFYRAVRLEGAPEMGMIQAGIRNDPKRLLPQIAHEPTTKTGLSHVDGAISMARFTPGTAQSDFFITVGALTPLDANPKQPGDNQGFAVFGRVVEGMDVVRRILAAPTSPTAGEGAMKGQMISAPVRILSARRAGPPKKTEAATQP